MYRSQSFLKKNYIIYAARFWKTKFHIFFSILLLQGSPPPLLPPLLLLRSDFSMLI